MSVSLKETILEYLRITAEAAGFGEPKNPAEIVGAIIGVFLSFLGIIFLCLVIYGGFIWMTSGGNEQKVIKAKQVLTNSVIGLLIIMSAYAITAFVFNALAQSAQYQ